MHDIEREIVFRNNDKLVAHDSEGFEAGQSSESHAVNDFIARRAAMDDINDRLHMVWRVYCIDTLAFGTLICVSGTVWR